MPDLENLKFKSITELLFFDNLALHYIIENTPPRILARVLNVADPRLAGALLGILNLDQRKSIHQLMKVENDSNQIKNTESKYALLQIATDLYSRGIVYQTKKHFFGSTSGEKLIRPDK